jgi:hypothetical protein
MKLLRGTLPKFKSKPKPSPVDDIPEYAELLSLIIHGKLTEREYAGLIVSDKDRALEGVKNPGCLIRDNLRKFLRKRNLQSDYRIICRQTDQPGLWYVGVVYESPMVTQETLTSRRQRAYTETS